MALALTLSCSPLARADDVQDLITGITSVFANVRQDAVGHAAQVGLRAVTPLGKQIVSGSPQVVKAATYALEIIVGQAGRPGAETERTTVARDLAQLLDAQYPVAARREFLSMLAIVGGDAEIPAIAQLLEQKELAEDACRTLDRIPGGPAMRALIDELPHAPDALKPAILNALARRHSKEAIPAIKQLIGKLDSDVTWEAYETLCRIGQTPPQIFPVPAEAVRVNRDRYMHGFLLAAEANLDHGDKKVAENLYATLAAFSVSKFDTQASLMGLAELKSPKLIEHALGYLAEPVIRDTAVATLESADIPSINDALLKAYPLEGAPNKAVLLQILSGRKADGLKTILESARADTAPEVRLAAKEILGEKPTEEDVHGVLLHGVLWLRDHAATLYLAIAKAKLDAGDKDGARTIYEEVGGSALPSSALAEAFNGIAAIGSVESQAVVDTAFNGIREIGPVSTVYPHELVVAIGRAHAAMLAANPDQTAAQTNLLKFVDTSAQQEVHDFAIEKLKGTGYNTRRIPQQHGFITDWKLLGPVPNPNNSAFKKSFFNESAAAPEQLILGNATLTWKTVLNDAYPGVVDLKGQFTPNDDVAAYAQATLTCPADMHVYLLVGTNDGYELWLNGVKLNEFGDGRGLQVDQDKIDATLQAGNNTIMLKVLQMGGSWQFCVRLTNTDGTPIDVATLQKAPSVPATPDSK